MPNLTNQINSAAAFITLHTSIIRLVLSHQVHQQQLAVASPLVSSPAKLSSIIKFFSLVCFFPNGYTPLPSPPRLRFVLPSNPTRIKSSICFPSTHPHFAPLLSRAPADITTRQLLALSPLEFLQQIDGLHHILSSPLPLPSLPILVSSLPYPLAPISVISGPLTQHPSLLALLTTYFQTHPITSIPLPAHSPTHKFTPIAPPTPVTLYPVTKHLKNTTNNINTYRSSPELSTSTRIVQHNGPSGAQTPTFKVNPLSPNPTSNKYPDLSLGIPGRTINVNNNQFYDINTASSGEEDSEVAYFEDDDPLELKYDSVLSSPSAVPFPTKYCPHLIDMATQTNTKINYFGGLFLSQIFEQRSLSTMAFAPTQTPMAEVLVGGQLLTEEQRLQSLQSRPDLNSQLSVTSPPCNVSNSLATMADDNNLSITLPTSSTHDQVHAISRSTSGRKLQPSQAQLLSAQSPSPKHAQGSSVSLSTPSVPVTSFSRPNDSDTSTTPLTSNSQQSQNINDSGFVQPLCEQLLVAGASRMNLLSPNEESSTPIQRPTQSALAALSLASTSPSVQSSRYDPSSSTPLYYMRRENAQCVNEFLTVRKGNKSNKKRLSGYKEEVHTLQKMATIDSVSFRCIMTGMKNDYNEDCYECRALETNDPALSPMNPNLANINTYGIETSSQPYEDPLIKQLQRAHAASTTSTTLCSYTHHNFNPYLPTLTVGQTDFSSLTDDLTGRKRDEYFASKAKCTCHKKKSNKIQNLHHTYSGDSSHSSVYVPPIIDDCPHCAGFWGQYHGHYEAYEVSVDDNEPYMNPYCNHHSNSSDSEGENSHLTGDDLKIYTVLNSHYSSSHHAESPMVTPSNRSTTHGPFTPLDDTGHRSNTKPPQSRTDQSIVSITPAQPSAVAALYSILKTSPHYIPRDKRKYLSLDEYHKRRRNILLGNDAATVNPLTGAISGANGGQGSITLSMNTFQTPNLIGSVTSSVGGDHSVQSSSRVSFGEPHNHVNTQYRGRNSVSCRRNGDDHDNSLYDNDITLLDSTMAMQQQHEKAFQSPSHRHKRTNSTHSHPRSPSAGPGSPVLSSQGSSHNLLESEGHGSFKNPINELSSSANGATTSSSRLSLKEQNSERDFGRLSMRQSTKQGPVLMFSLNPDILDAPDGEDGSSDSDTEFPTAAFPQHPLPSDGEDILLKAGNIDNDLVQCKKAPQPNFTAIKSDSVSMVTTTDSTTSQSVISPHSDTKDLKTPIKGKKGSQPVEITKDVKDKRQSRVTTATKKEKETRHVNLFLVATDINQVLDLKYIYERDFLLSVRSYKQSLGLPFEIPRRERIGLHIISHNGPTSVYHTLDFYQPESPPTLLQLQPANSDIVGNDTSSNTWGLNTNNTANTSIRNTRGGGGGNVRGRTRREQQQEPQPPPVYIPFEITDVSPSPQLFNQRKLSHLDKKFTRAAQKFVESTLEYLDDEQRKILLKRMLALGQYNHFTFHQLAYIHRARLHSQNPDPDGKGPVNIEFPYEILNMTQRDVELVVILDGEYTPTRHLLIPATDPKKIKTNDKNAAIIARQLHDNALLQPHLMPFPDPNKEKCNFDQIVNYYSISFQNYLDNTQRHDELDFSYLNNITLSDLLSIASGHGLETSNSIVGLMSQHAKERKNLARKDENRDLSAARAQQLTMDSTMYVLPEQYDVGPINPFPTHYHKLHPYYTPLTELINDKIITASAVITTDNDTESYTVQQLRKQQLLTAQNFRKNLRFGINFKSFNNQNNLNDLVWLVRPKTNTVTRTIAKSFGFFAKKLGIKRDISKLKEEEESSRNGESLDEQRKHLQIDDDTLLHDEDSTENRQDESSNSPRGRENDDNTVSDSKKSKVRAIHFNQKVDVNSVNDKPRFHYHPGGQRTPNCLKLGGTNPPNVPLTSCLGKTTVIYTLPIDIDLNSIYEQSFVLRTSDHQGMGMNYTCFYRLVESLPFSIVPRSRLPLHERSYDGFGWTSILKNLSRYRQPSPALSLPTANRVLQQLIESTNDPTHLQRKRAKRAAKQSRRHGHHNSDQLDDADIDID